MARGGKREGAGRKPKERAAEGFFEDAESYLLAVVQGKVLPDAVRVQAAKTLISYQQPKRRAPVKSLPPAKLHEKEQRSVASATVADFEEKAKIIRAKHAAMRTQK